MTAIVGTFTLVIDAVRIGGVDVETVNRVRVYRQGAAVIRDTAGDKVWLPHEAEADASIPYSITLPTDVTTGTSDEVGFRVVVNYGTGYVSAELAAQAKDSSINFSDIVDEVTVPLSQAQTLRDESLAAKVAAEAAQAAAEAVPTTTDTLIAAQIEDADSDTTAALSATYASVTHRPVNVAEAYGTDDTAVRAALAAANTGARALYLPKGQYAITNDLSIDRDEFAFFGDGEETELVFTNGGLVIDGSAGWLFRPSLRDLRIRSTGTAAPALHALGAGAGTGVARLDASNLHLSSENDAALLYEGSYVAAFHGCYFSDSVYGIQCKKEETTDAIGVNLLSFFGGEANGNDHGVALDTPSGVNFFGFGVEGNSISGMTVTGLARGFGVYGGYFELNNGPDIKISAASASGPFVVQGCIFHCTSATKTESILLERGNAISVRDNFFAGLDVGDVAIKVDETTAAAVNGEGRNNIRSDGGTVYSYSASTPFNMSQVGQVTTAGTSTTSSGQIRKVLSTVVVPDFGSIGSGATAELALTVAGAAVGDDATAHPNSLPESGLVWSAVVTAANTVTLRLANVTGSAIDPAARSWRMRVWR